jgi:hypothetical protein
LKYEFYALTYGGSIVKQRGYPALERRGTRQGGVVITVVLVAFSNEKFPIDF